MPSSSNGQQGDHHDPIRRLRYDDLFSIMERTYARGLRQEGRTTVTASMPWLERGVSGRWFVIVAALVVLVLWGLLYLGFREWRARYRLRAAYGANQVAPMVDAFDGIAPPDVDPAGWRDAVARTHAMLVTVTASNLLGLAEMQALRGELDGAVARARAHPDNAVAELAAVWDEMSERGEFLLKDTRSLTGDRHPRPDVLPSYGADRVAPALDPLAEVAPPGVDHEHWRDALARTRALVLDVTASRSISTMRMKDLRIELDRVVAHARARPDLAIKDLAAVWDSLDRLYRSFFPDRKAGQVRPEIFNPRH